MSEDPRLIRLALERGWITREEARSGRPAESLLTPRQIEELAAGRALADRLLGESGLKAADLAEPRPSRFGRYEIVRELGLGGGGRVYLAKDPELGRPVAVKILDRGIAADLERFRREMAILAALRHPNIVTIHDAGTEGGRPYYAMEYAEGRSLAEAKPPLPEAVAILEAVARACHAAHEKGIVHRDLKPANILLAERPLVADFGIAKMGDAELTETGQTLGTPHYMSPEQAEGRDVDPRSDVYSLGVILYELMTGKRPFTGSGAFDIARKVMRDEPPAPRSLDPRLPRDLEIVTLRAMAKNPADRYPTAQALAEDLRAWREGRPISARPAGLRERLVAAARRRPRLAAAAAVGVPLLAVLLLVASAKVAPALNRLRLESAQKVILAEVDRIRAWEVNLYKPVEEMETSFAELEKAVANLEDVLRGPGLTPVLRHRGHSAAARAFLFMGRTEEARRQLERAVGAGYEGRIGEDYFERARLTWEDLLREAASKNEPEAKRLLDRFRADLRSALDVGFEDEWTGEVARALLRLADEKEKAVEATLADFERLSKRREKRPEEVAKWQGDLYLLLRKYDEAVEQYKRAVHLRQAYVQAYNGLALAHQLKGGGENAQQVRDAFAAAFRAIDINPRYEGSYFLFALLCRQALRGSPRELTRINPDALALVESALEKLRVGSRVRPDSYPILMAHGTACVLTGFARAGQKKDIGPAVAEGLLFLRRALERDPARQEAWLATGAAYVLQGLADRGNAEAIRAAVRHLEEARRRPPESAFLHRWAGYGHFLAGDPGAAVAAWKRALELDPGLREELENDIAEAEGRK
jgi:tetratricopeptide (TPR) repeat protein/predicted Ser/Thr protein kinase